MILSFLAAALPILLGFVVVRTLAPRLTGRLLVASLSVPIGYGVVSCLAFVWLLVIGHLSRGVTALEALAVVAGMLWITRLNSRFLPPSATPNKVKSTPAVYLERFLWTAFLIVLMMICARYVVNLRMSPHGSFDAWESYNTKARVLFLSGGDWRHDFKAITDIVPDYPLSLPLTIAAIWAAIGNDPTLAPVLVAGLYLASSIGILLSALTELRSRSQGLFACILLLGTPFYVHLSYALYADIPLACLMIGTVVLLALFDANSRPELLILAGLAAGLSCWMKNEGILFSACLLPAYVAALGIRKGVDAMISSGRRLLMGATIPVLVVGYFKYSLGGGNSIARQGLHSILHKLTIHHRYHIVRVGFERHLFEGLGDWGLNILLVLAIYLLLVGLKPGLRPECSVIGVGIAIVVMLGCYFLIFVASPYDTPPFDIDWYMLVTVQRLFMQLWPVFLFVLFLVARSMDEAESLAADSLSPPARKAQPGRAPI